MIDNRLYKVVDFIYKLLVLNFAFFFGIVIGVVVVGIFPATIALIKGLETISEEDAVTLLKNFIRRYLKVFVKANVLGLGVSLLFIGAYINFQLLTNSQSLVTGVLSVVLFMFTLYLGLALFNSVLLYRYKEEHSLKMVLIDGCIYTFVNLKYSLLQLVLAVLYLFVLIKLPILFLFGGTSGVILLQQKIFNLAVNKTTTLVLTKEA